jgi:hypothetical protein
MKIKKRLDVLLVDQGYADSRTKAQAVITPPTANTTLTYTGEKQELLATAGLTTFGEIEYSLDNEDWVKTIPTAKEAGKYVVYYRVVGSDNYNGATGSLAVTIKAHEHDWKYSASGAVITATCSGEGLCNINETTIALEKNNKANFVYDGFFMDLGTPEAIEEAEKYVSM